MRSVRAQFKYARRQCKLVERLINKLITCKDMMEIHFGKTLENTPNLNLHCLIALMVSQEKLILAYNNSLRRLLGLPSHNSATSMIVNLNIPSFGELLRKYVYNFRNRLETSDNVIIRGIYLSHITFQSGIWDWWRDILSP